MLNGTDLIILNKLLDSTTPVSTKTLSQECVRSANTIRKEIDLINEEAEKHGCRIASKSSVGHYLEIIDPEAADPYLNNLRIQIKRDQFMDIRYPAHIYELTRKCLCNESGLTTDKLCQQYYCSRSVMLQELNSVRSVLADFNLTLVNRRNGKGLIVQGSEWDLRQCIILQYKIYRNTRSSDLYAYENRSLEGNPNDLYIFTKEEELMINLAGEELTDLLKNTKDFYIPEIHIAKIASYIVLCSSRHSQSDALSFNSEKKNKVIDSAEYKISKELCHRVSVRLGIDFNDNDILSIAMLFLSYETKNEHLTELSEYEELKHETEDLSEYLSNHWDYEPELFDEDFNKDCACYLYALKNRLLYGVRPDEEIMGYVNYKGIGTSDFCVDFARFYENRNGIKLDKINALTSFYLFYRVRRRRNIISENKLRFSAIIISQYGFPCAAALATDILLNYSDEVGTVLPLEVYEQIPDGRYDILIADWDMEKDSLARYYNLPILTVHFTPGRRECLEIDQYIRLRHCKEEIEIINKSNFLKVNLRDKEEVFACLSENIRDWGKTYSADVIATHLRQNDEYIELEKENGVISLPVLLDDKLEQKIVVLLNEGNLLWNKHFVHVIVCYNRIGLMHTSNVIGSILERFLNLSVQEVVSMASGKIPPIKILYPEVDI